MKKLYVFIFTFLLCSTAWGQTVDNAIIKYEDKGRAFYSTIVYIDGVKKAIEKYNLETGELANHSYYDGRIGHMTTYDVSKKPVALKLPDDRTAFKKFFHNEPVGEPYVTGEVLGKQCRVYTESATQQGASITRTVYYWNGIVLRADASISLKGKVMNSGFEAVDIQLNVPISSEKFELKKGVRVVSKLEAATKLASTLYKGVKQAKEAKRIENLEDYKNPYEKPFMKYGMWILIVALFGAAGFLFFKSDDGAKPKQE